MRISIDPKMRDYIASLGVGGSGATLPPAPAGTRRANPGRAAGRTKPPADRISLGTAFLLTCFIVLVIAGVAHGQAGGILERGGDVVLEQQIEEALAAVSAQVGESASSIPDRDPTQHRLLAAEAAIESLRHAIPSGAGRAQGLLLAASIIAIILAVWRLLHMDHRQTELERRVQALAAPTAAQADPAEPVPGDGAAGSITSDSSASSAPSASAASLFAAQALIRWAERIPSIREKPLIPRDPWSVGISTHRGFVRTENQDHAFVFRIAGRDVAIVADGCGGLPRGREAAELAVVACSVGIIRAIGSAPTWHDPNLQDVIAVGLARAQRRIEIAGRSVRTGGGDRGLRTTLIVVVGGDQEYAYGYIGDGGGVVVRTSGRVDHFLVPQKANGAPANVLAASLGPEMQGAPVLGSVERKPGDLCLIGSDGIFDVTERYGFPKDAFRACVMRGGDLNLAADEITTELASKTDDLGYICADNLTLCLMAAGHPPVVERGFWLGDGSQGQST